MHDSGDDRTSEHPEAAATADESRKSGSRRRASVVDKMWTRTGEQARLMSAMHAASA